MQKGWVPKLKNYRHFDGLKSAKRLNEYVRDEQLVATHPFYPLVSYELKWDSLAQKDGAVRKRKKRTIKYASRTDSAIFSYYRHLLSQPYEAWLERRDLGSSVLAYRSIPKGKGKGGKGNIDFAYDAFSKIRQMGDCTYACLDISKFFDQLDHAKVKRDWAQILGRPDLPRDHFNVFRNLTRYGEVPLDWAYQALGIKGDVELRDGSVRQGFQLHADEINAQLCYPDDFRELIVGNKLIKSHKDRGRPTIGVPQGVPLSDLLANIYLREFDVIAKREMQALGGYYARYSDDIFLLLPLDEHVMMRMIKFLENTLTTVASPLKFNTSKTEMGLYYRRSGRQVHYRIIGKGDGANYLGFRFDGEKVYLRDQTLSNFWRANARAVNRSAFSAAKRFLGQSQVQIRSSINEGRVLEETGRVENFERHAGVYKMWTFWTYARRAHKQFSEFGSGIERQLRNHKEIVRKRLDEATEKAFRITNKPAWQLKQKRK